MKTGAALLIIVLSSFIISLFFTVSRPVPLGVADLGSYLIFTLIATFIVIFVVFSVLYFAFYKARLES